MHTELEWKESKERGGFYGNQLRHFEDRLLEGPVYEGRSIEFDVVQILP